MQTSGRGRKKAFTCRLLIGLHLLLGIGAVFGGGLLTLAPDGSLLSMPLSLLESSPFQSYLVPGILLLVLIGIYPLLIVAFLISEKPLPVAETFNLYRDTHWAWMHSLYVGFILIIWLTVEMYMLRAIYLVHVFYMFLALTILAVTLLPSVKQHYSRQRQ